MADWNGSMRVEMFGHSDEVPLTNAWGRNYPSFLDEPMAGLLGIEPGHRVLDVGGGQYPFAPASLNLDAFVDDDIHRQGKAAVRTVPLVAGYAERMPLQDGSFDFVISRHTLEHVLDPEAVAREMSRVARAGFVDTPGPVFESVLGFPPHLWIISVEDDTLVFRRRKWLRNPLLNAMRPFWWFDAASRFDFELKYRNVTMTQHRWEGSLRVRVEDDGSAPDYGVPENAALAHLDFALNALMMCSPPVHEVKQDIAMALRFRPDWALAHNALGVVLWAENRRDEALERFRLAATLEPGQREFAENARLTPSSDGRPMLVPLPDEDLPHYPDVARLARDLKIGSKTSVLEVTSSAPWFPQSEVRQFQPDGSLTTEKSRYDVLIVREGLGEVQDLAATFARLESLAVRGYVELPTKTAAVLVAHPAMQWYAEPWGSGLAAFRRPDGQSACHHLLAVLERVHQDVAKRLAANPYGVMRAGKTWEGSIGIEIRRTQGYDAADPAQRAQAEAAYRASLSRVGVVEPTRVTADTSPKPRGLGAPEPPSWLLPLAEMLSDPRSKRRGHFLDCPPLCEAARARGWNLPTGKNAMRKADTLVVWRCETTSPGMLVKLATEARQGGLVILGFPPTESFEDLRGKLETLFQATVHFVDPDSDCSRLVAVLWNRERISVARKTLVTLHRNAFRMMGGGEAVVFQTLLKAEREAGVRADVTAALRLRPDAHDVVHVVSLYQPDHVETIRGWTKPKVVMPIHWDGPRVRWVTAVLPYVLAPDRPEEERRQLLRLYADRTLAANGVTLEQARESGDVIRALRSVRDLGDRVIATGPQELLAMDQMLGPTSAGTGSVHLGVDTELFRNADAEDFEKAFGLRGFVLCVGRVEPMKNQLMTAYALRETDRQIVLLGGSSDPEYLELCKHWGGERLVHLSNQPPWMVASAYKAAACHVLASWWEVPGLVSVEAAVAGCPVVATECGTIRHYLGDDAWYCDPADPESIRAAVDQACEAKGSERVRRLQERCIAEFSHQRCAQAYRAIYDELAGAGRRRFLLTPDWQRRETWEPFVRQYVHTYSQTDSVTLCLLVEEPTGAGAEEASSMVGDMLAREKVETQSCADIELVDLASIGEIAGFIECGSEAEARLRTALGLTAEKVA
ncbi:MAG: glycosyltransferase [Fimbriimonadia bacterium]|jgi:glycosyltransferase involved in cell wall biosynthesis/SAM-dependent methyltransferase